MLANQKPSVARTASGGRWLEPERDGAGTAWRRPACKHRTPKSPDYGGVVKWRGELLDIALWSRRDGEIIAVALRPHVPRDE